MSVPNEVLASCVDRVGTFLGAPEAARTRTRAQWARTLAADLEPLRAARAQLAALEGCRAPLAVLGEVAMRWPRTPTLELPLTRLMRAIALAASTLDAGAQMVRLEVRLLAPPSTCTPAEIEELRGQVRVEIKRAEGALDELAAVVRAVEALEEARVAAGLPERLPDPAPEPTGRTAA